MTLQEFLDSEVCDVPVEVILNDGTKMIFRCDGSNSTELTGMVVGCDVFLPFMDIKSVEILTEDQYKVQAKNREAYWYR